jgi:transposase InsO family protein
MSARALASCCTSMSRSSGGSRSQGTESPGNRAQRARRTRVGNDGRLLGTAGWEYVHVCIDDATRLAYAEVLEDEKGTTAVGFLRRALAFYASHGIIVEQLLTDNGSAYRSVVHAIACRTLGIRRLRTRPYRSQTNGKACVLGWRCRPLGRRGSPHLLV